MAHSRKSKKRTKSESESGSDRTRHGPNRFDDLPIQGTVADRRVVPDRRPMQDRTQSPSCDTGLERRRGPGRRRGDLNRAAEEGEMTDEQFLVLMAIDAFKRANNVTYPTWSDILEIFRRLGYRKVQSSQINLPNAEDWTERPDTPISPESIGGSNTSIFPGAFDEDENEFTEAA